MSASTAYNNQQNKPYKVPLKSKIILITTIILTVVALLYWLVIPELVNVKVQQGYKATYETIEENLYGQNKSKTLDVVRAYCYWTRELNIKKIPAGPNNTLPNIDYIYKFSLNDETLDSRISIYCGYNSKTKETVYFGTDGTYYSLEQSASESNKYGDYASYRKIICSKFLSDVVEFLY